MSTSYVIYKHVNGEKLYRTSTGQWKDDPTLLTEDQVRPYRHREPEGIVVSAMNSEGYLTVPVEYAPAEDN